MIGKRLLVPVVAAAAALLLVSCGSTTSTGSAVTTVAAASGQSTPPGGSPGVSVAPGVTTANSGGGNRRAALQAWEACLTKNGVTLPSVPAGGGGGGNGNGSFPPFSGAPDGSTPTSGGRGGGLGGLNTILQDPANATAVTACKSLQPTFGGAGGGGGNPANRAAYQAYLSCLADNGITVPSVGSTPASGPRVTVDQTNPNFAAANEKCKVLLPQNNGSGAPQTTSTPTTGA